VNAIHPIADSFFLEIIGREEVGAFICPELFEVIQAFLEPPMFPGCPKIHQNADCPVMHSANPPPHKLPIRQREFSEVPQQEMPIYAKDRFCGTSERFCQTKPPTALWIDREEEKLAAFFRNAFPIRLPSAASRLLSASDQRHYVN
jgi:hypothetical protein